MPAADADLTPLPTAEGYTELPFPPLKKAHILHCSVHYWYPKYRAITPKARLIPVEQGFVHYLRSDGIVLPPEDGEQTDDEVEWHTNAARVNEVKDGEEDGDGDEGEDADVDADPSHRFQQTHEAIKTAIGELGGKVAPKLNWSAPKDATWINPTNSMACSTANDVYLMLKSSDFVTHDLEHWDDGCVSDDDAPEWEDDVVDGKAGEEGAADRGNPPYHLLLRKHINIAPSVEFRCFVRHRHLLGITQRDPNHYDFLFPMVSSLRSLIQDFFDEKLKHTFPDEDFVFDVYVPSPYKRVWLVDVNPWAATTDPLLFSWLELLTMEGPEAGSFADSDGDPGDPETDAYDSIDGEIDELDRAPPGVIRIPFRPRDDGTVSAPFLDDDVQSSRNGVENTEYVPDFRLIKKDDPEAYSFNSPQYSAHKLPADVVEASQSGPGPLREFAEQWKEELARERVRHRDR